MICLKPPFRANNMEGLFRKVSKGLYQPIPKKYSLELSNLVRNLLKSNPDKRPTCDEILKMPSVSKKSNLYFPNSQIDDESNELLKTIIFPKNIMYLTDQLPTPCYEEEYEFDEKRKTSTIPNKRSQKAKNRKILSRSKLSSISKRSDKDLAYEIDTNSASNDKSDLSKAKKIMQSNLAKLEGKKSKINYRDIIKKHESHSPDTNSEVMKKNIELSKIQSPEKENILKLGSSRTPHIKQGKGSAINNSALGMHESPQIKNIKKMGVGIPVYRRKKPDNYEQSTNDASSYYSK